MKLEKCEGTACATYLGQVRVNHAALLVVSEQDNSYTVVEEDLGTHTVYKYALNKENRVTMEKVFAISKYKAIKEVNVFADYALVLSDSETIDVVYFKDHRGQTVPNFNAVLLAIKESIVKMAVGKLASSGTFKLLVACR